MVTSQKSMVDRLISFIVRRRNYIEKFFILMVAISAVFSLMVKVNYDLTEYLPSWAPTKQGIDVMEAEFGYPGTARVMIKDVTVYEAKLYKEKIANIEGVDNVSWADTATDIYTSQAFLEAADIEDYYKDNCAVYDVFFKEGDSDRASYAAIDEMRNMFGDKCSISGPTVENKTVSENMAREMPRILTVGVLFIIFVLMLTTNSWFEPVLFMVTMGAAVIINTGTNIIFGTISFISSNAAALLQIAVAMDYSIFLLHTFTAEKNKGIGVEQAMENALRIAMKSIVSSAFTTVIGFLALALMQFTIGYDIGMVLAKGILCSMLTVLLLMPALILRWQDIIEKLQHKPFIPPLDKFAKRVFGLRFVVAALVIVLIVPCYVAQGMTHYMYGTSVVACAEGTPTWLQKKEIDDVFGESNMIVVVVPNKGNVIEKQLVDELEDQPYIRNVTALSTALPQGIPESFLPKSITDRLHTESYSRMMINVRSDTETDLAFTYDDQIKTIVSQYYPEDTHFIGKTPVAKDIKRIILKDNKEVNMISILGVALVVFMAFGSLAITLVVLVPIEVAIYVNMALPYLYNQKLAFLGYLMVSSMQLGATVDYSILLTNNYLALRQEEPDKKKAAIKTISKSTLSIMTSGMVLTIVGYGLNFMSSVPTVVDLGHLIGRGGLFSMIFVLTLLPLLLTLFDGTISRGRARTQKIKEAHAALASKTGEKVRLLVSNIWRSPFRKNLKPQEER
ncbi:efflux RND transporter permease subunit [Oscillospiraceae bacterium LTW-04]|nr:MMPL family transporter [Oscillospiraceae bacterium MB24-C1]